MRRIVYVMLVFVSAFLLNIGLYYYNPDYNFFLKRLKYGDSLINKESQSITDDYTIRNQECDCSNVESVCASSGALKKDDTPAEDDSRIKTSSGQIEELFSYFDRNILKLKEHDDYYRLFDITDEYPGKYTVYSSENFEIYLFLDGNFDDLYNMFELLSNDKTVENRFTLNRLDNFGRRSFFINTVNDDGKVRLVVDSGKILFGLYTKKSYYYSKLKPILEKFNF